MSARDQLADVIEPILFRRLAQERLMGYTVETSQEVADAVLGMIKAAVLEEREACAIIADGIMVDMMNAALTGLPEQARLRESMANTAEKIRIHIRARPPIPD